MKKKDEVPISIRTYDKDGFRRRAACVCVKDNKEEDVLLVSRTRRDNEWIFPGGGIEPSEDPKHAASREVVEEAGVIGSIVRCLGIFESGQTRTCVYVMQVSSELAEWDDSIKCGRKRMWVSVSDAASILGHSHTQICYLYQLKASPPGNSFAQTPPGLLIDPNNATCHRVDSKFCSSVHESFSDRYTPIDVATNQQSTDRLVVGQSSGQLTVCPTVANVHVERHDDFCCHLAKCQNGSTMPETETESEKETPTPHRTLGSPPGLRLNRRSIDDVFEEKSAENSSKGIKSIRNEEIFP